MKKYVMMPAGIIAVCLLLGFVCTAPAADANQPKVTPKEKTITVVGAVSEVNDSSGNVTEVTVTAHKTVAYRITLDDKGKELAKTMAGKHVKVTGTLEVKDGVKWLTVEKFSEEKAKPKPKTKEKSAEKPSQNK